jgi:hypothetical protein
MFSAPISPDCNDCPRVLVPCGGKAAQRRACLPPASTRVGAVLCGGLECDGRRSVASFGARARPLDRRLECARRRQQDRLPRAILHALRSGQAAPVLDLVDAPRHFGATSEPPAVRTFGGTNGPNDGPKGDPQLAPRPGSGPRSSLPAAARMPRLDHEVVRGRADVGKHYLGDVEFEEPGVAVRVVERRVDLHQ